MFMEKPDFAETAYLVRRAVTDPDSFAFVLLAYNRYEAIEAIATALRTHFPERPFLRLRIDKQNYSTLTERIYAHEGILLIEDFQHLVNDPDMAVGFNQRRDRISKQALQIVACLPDAPEHMRAVKENLKDWWSIRNLITDAAVPKPLPSGQQWMDSSEPAFVEDTEVLATLKARIAELPRQKANWPLFESLYDQIAACLNRHDQVALREEQYHLAQFLQIDEVALAVIEAEVGNTLFGAGQLALAKTYLFQALDVFEKYGVQYEKAYVFLSLAKIFRQEGNFDETIYYAGTALDIAEEQSFQVITGVASGIIGQSFSEKGDFETALEYLIKSLSIQQTIGDINGEGTTLNSISLIYSTKGDYETALEYLTESLNIQQAIGDKSGEGSTLNNISAIYQAKGDYDIAFEYLLTSLKIQQAIGNKPGEGTTLNNIGLIYSAKGDYDIALEFLTKSLNISQAIGDKSGEGTTLNNISQIYYAEGDYDTALEFLTQSLNIQQAIGDKSGEEKTLNNISTIYSAKGEYDTALEYLLKSLNIQQAIGDKPGEGTSLNNISQIYSVKGDYATALEYLLKSLNIQQAIGDKPGEGTTLNNISLIYSAKGDYDTALEYLIKSLNIRKAIGDKPGLTATLHNIAHIYRDQKQDLEQYFEHEKEAFQLAQETQNAQGLFETSRSLGYTLCRFGQREQGLPLLQQALQIGRATQNPKTQAVEEAIQQFSQT